MSTHVTSESSHEGAGVESDRSVRDGGSGVEAFIDASINRISAPSRTVDSGVGLSAGGVRSGIFSDGFSRSGIDSAANWTEKPVSFSLSERHGLTLREARMVVWQDVVDQLSAGMYIAEDPVYVAPVGMKHVYYDFINEVDYSQSCNVCAIGSCIVSAAKLFNHELSNAYISQGGIQRALSDSGIYSYDEVVRLEDVYERNYVSRWSLMNGYLDRTDRLMQLALDLLLVDGDINLIDETV